MAVGEALTDDDFAEQRVIEKLGRHGSSRYRVENLK
jgi:hypothetical protein